MSLFILVPELRARGIVLDMAHSFFWLQHTKQNRNTVYADSCGIFVIGASSLTRIVNSWDEVVKASCDGLEKAQKCGFVEDAMNASDPEDAGDEGEVLEEGAPKKTKKLRKVYLPVFEEGAGQPIESYLPKKKPGDTGLAQTVISKLNESLTILTQEEEFPGIRMPPCRAVLIKHWIFDPRKELFKGGAHMPLLVYFGVHLRRNAHGWDKVREKKLKCLERKELKQAEKATKGSTKGKGKRP